MARVVPEHCIGKIATVVVLDQEPVCAVVIRLAGVVTFMLCCKKVPAFGILTELKKGALPTF